MITDEDDLLPPLEDLERQLVMAQGVFPEERSFAPVLIAEPRPGGV